MTDPAELATRLRTRAINEANELKNDLLEAAALLEQLADGQKPGSGGYVKKCLIHVREDQEDDMFSPHPLGGAIVRLDSYAIIPLEEYQQLASRAAFWDTPTLTTWKWSANMTSAFSYLENNSFLQPKWP